MKTETNTFVKSTLLGTIAAFAFLGMVSASLANAATYLYVTTDGELASIEADTSMEAINTAPNIAYNSGVMLSSYDEMMNENDADEEDYAYVDSEGDVEYVEADSDAEALDESDDDAAYNSGVLETDEFEDSEDLE